MNNVLYRTKGHLAAGLAFLLFCAGRVASQTTELKPEQLYQTILPSVMTLTVETRSGGKFVGTAFLAVEEGMAVTAWHLVKDARQVTARFADGEVATVTGVVDRDVTKDIALVRVSTSGRPLARLCPVLPAVGTRAFVVGAPRGFEFSLGDGLISQVPVIDGFRQIQISCPISTGNSGGPVLNQRGEVLGVVAWSEKDSQNLNFATPASCVQELNRTLPPLAWEAVPKSRLARTPGGPSEPMRDRCRGPDEKREQAAFREALKKSAGRTLTVIVVGLEEDKAYTFTVPPDFVK